MIPDRHNVSNIMMHAKRPWGELLPRARMIPLAMAAILAVATAIECHSHDKGIQYFLSWGLSLAYGALCGFGGRSLCICCGDPTVAGHLP